MEPLLGNLRYTFILLYYKWVNGAISQLVPNNLLFFFTHIQEQEEAEESAAVDIPEGAESYEIT